MRITKETRFLNIILCIALVFSNIAISSPVVSAQNVSDSISNNNVSDNNISANTPENEEVITVNKNRAVESEDVTLQTAANSDGVVNKTFDYIATNYSIPFIKVGTAIYNVWSGYITPSSSNEENHVFFDGSTVPVHYDNAIGGSVYGKKFVNETKMEDYMFVFGDHKLGKITSNGVYVLNNETKEFDAVYEKSPSNEYIYSNTICVTAYGTAWGGEIYENGRYNNYVYSLDSETHEVTKIAVEKYGTSAFTKDYLYVFTYNIVYRYDRNDYTNVERLSLSSFPLSNTIFNIKGTNDIYYCNYYKYGTQSLYKLDSENFTISQIADSGNYGLTADGTYLTIAYVDSNGVYYELYDSTGLVNSKRINNISYNCCCRIYYDADMTKGLGYGYGYNGYEFVYDIGDQIKNTFTYKKNDQESYQVISPARVFFVDMFTYDKLYERYTTPDIYYNGTAYFTLQGIGDHTNCDEGGSVLLNAQYLDCTDTIVPYIHSYTKEEPIEGNYKCTEKIKVNIICKTCGDVGEENVDSPTTYGEHSYKREIDYHNNCYRDLTYVDTCEYCQDVITTDDRFKGHDWTDWIYDSELTCTKGSKGHRSCKNCGITYETTFDPLKHDFEILNLKQESTCTTCGVANVKCKTCGIIITNYALEPKDHNFDVAPYITVDESGYEGWGTDSYCPYPDTKNVGGTNEGKNYSICLDCGYQFYSGVEGSSSYIESTSDYAYSFAREVIYQDYKSDYSYLLASIGANGEAASACSEEYSSIGYFHNKNMPIYALNINHLDNITLNNINLDEYMKTNYGSSFNFKGLGLKDANKQKDYSTISLVPEALDDKLYSLIYIPYSSSHKIRFQNKYTTSKIFELNKISDYDFEINQQLNLDTEYQIGPNGTYYLLILEDIEPVYNWKNEPYFSGYTSLRIFLDCYDVNNFERIGDRESYATAIWQYTPQQWINSEMVYTDTVYNIESGVKVKLTNRSPIFDTYTLFIAIPYNPETLEFDPLAVYDENTNDRSNSYNMMTVVTPALENPEQSSVSVRYAESDYENAPVSLTVSEYDYAGNDVECTWYINDEDNQIEIDSNRFEYDNVIYEISDDTRTLSAYTKENIDEAITKSVQVVVSDKNNANNSSIRIDGYLVINNIDAIIESTPIIDTSNEKNSVSGNTITAEKDSLITINYNGLYTKDHENYWNVTDTQPIWKFKNTDGEITPFEIQNVLANSEERQRISGDMSENGSLTFLATEDGIVICELNAKYGNASKEYNITVVAKDEPIEPSPNEPEDEPTPPEIPDDPEIPDEPEDAEIVDVTFEYIGKPVKIGKQYKKSDILVYAYYSNGDIEQVDPADWTASSFDVTAEHNEYTGTYEGFIKKYSVPGYYAIDHITAEYIGKPVVIGKKYSKEDVKVTIWYTKDETSDNYTELSSSQWSVEDKDLLITKEGKNKDVAVYKDGDKKFKATYYISGKNVAVGIEAKYTGKDVPVGKEYSKDDVVVYLIYADGTKEKLPSNKWKESGLKVSKIGKNKFTATYKDFKTTYSITGIEETIGKSNKPNKPVKTGDNNLPWLYIMILLFAIAGISYYTRYNLAKRKVTKDNNENNK